MENDIEIIINKDLKITTKLNNEEIDQLLVYVNKLQDIHKGIVVEDENEKK